MMLSSCAVWAGSIPTGVIRVGGEHSLFVSLHSHVCWHRLLLTNPVITGNSLGWTWSDSHYAAVHHRQEGLLAYEDSAIPLLKGEILVFWLCLFSGFQYLLWPQTVITNSVPFRLMYLKGCLSVKQSEESVCDLAAFVINFNLQS